MAFALVAAVTARVSADPPAGLDYLRPRADAACHDVAWMRRLLATRFGHDPFAADAPEMRALTGQGVARAVVEVTPEGALRRLRVRFVDGDGRDVFPRRTWAEAWAPETCEQIERLALHALSARMLSARAEAVSDADAGALDDATPVDASIAEPDASIAEPVAAIDVEPTADVTREGAARVELSATVGVGVAAGHSPSATPAVRVGVWASRAWWLVGVELEGQPAVASASFEGRAVREDRALAALVGCAVWRWLSGCVVARSGVLWSDYGASGARTTEPQLDLGARALATWRVARRWSVWGAVEGFVPLLPVDYRYTETQVTAWRATVGGGAYVGVRLGF